MSAFDDFNTQCIGESFDVYGATSVTISTVAYDAIVDQYSAERELESGGYVGDYDAQAVIQIADLSSITAPIERTLEGLTATVASRTFRIDRVIVDSLTATLLLNNPKKHAK